MKNGSSQNYYLAPILIFEANVNIFNYEKQDSISELLSSHDIYLTDVR